MEIYLDREKTLKFQLSSPDMSDEGKSNLVGNFLLEVGDLSIALGAEINKDWVATVEVPKLTDILKNPKAGKAKASFCLHDDEYYFKVWKDEVEIIKGRPELQATVIEEDDEEKPSKKNKKSKSKAVVEAVIVEEEPEVEEAAQEVPEVQVVEAKNESNNAIPTFQRRDGGVGKKTSGNGLKSYLEHLGK